MSGERVGSLRAHRREQLGKRLADPDPLGSLGLLPRRSLKVAMRFRLSPHEVGGIASTTRRAARRIASVEGTGRAVFMTPGVSVAGRGGGHEGQHAELWSASGTPLALRQMARCDR